MIEGQIQEPEQWLFASGRLATSGSKLAETLPDFEIHCLWVLHERRAQLRHQADPYLYEQQS